MKKLLLLVLVFAFGYGYGHWYAKGPIPVSAATVSSVPEAGPAQPPTKRKILYYRDPMHPSYTSDKPGKAPDCGMELAPVYEEVPPPAGEPAEPTVYVSPEKQQLIGVQYGAADYGPAFQTIRAAARVGLDETKVVRVTTMLGGWIDKLDVNLVGTRVRQGQKLLTLYNPQWQQEYRALVRARTVGAGEQDEVKLAAAKQQLQSLGLGDEEIDTMRAARRSQWKLGIYSPINGVVLEQHVHEKQKVTPDPLYTIADLSLVWVTADFLEADASWIKLGQRASLTVPVLAGRVFHGRVDSILPQLDPNTQALKVRIAFANPDYALKPEMYGSVELRSGGENRLLVPQEAVMNSGLRQVVFVDRGNGRLAPRTVKTGRQFGNHIEILSGLKAGERVVTSGNFLIDSESQLKASANGNDRSNH